MNDLSFHFLDNCLKYTEIQLSGMKSNRQVYKVRSMLEWEVIQDRFSSQMRNVLDLGCGLGRMSVWANWQQLGNGEKYYLADRTEVTENVVGGYPAKEEWDNDLEMTNLFAAENGLTNRETIRRETLLDLPRIDLLMSIAAVGYHWPIKDWVNILNQLDCGVMIFTVRPDHYHQFPGTLHIVDRTAIPILKEDAIVVK